MGAYYLAVDIGASSGRHILAYMENGKLQLEEVHRFYNGMSEKDGEMCWDFNALFKEIKIGLKKCKEIGKVPVSIGVDTWGVDFVLLDENDQVVHRLCHRQGARPLQITPAGSTFYWNGLLKDGTPAQPGSYRVRAQAHMNDETVTALSAAFVIE